MCKLAILTGITNETKDNAWVFVKEMSKQMSAPNCVEKDGIGYAAIDDQGQLFGEKWVNYQDAFKNRSPYGSEIDNQILKKFKILNREKVYGTFGIFNENIRTITLHSRTSTNEVSYKNTHPFVENSTSLIHNGIIYNHNEFEKKTSTCDSEVLLHLYNKHNIANKPGKFRKIASKLDGYYAMGVLSKTNEGMPVLDVIKDNAAKLEAFFIQELNTIVFATPKYDGNPVEAACKALGFTIVSKYEVKDNRLQRFNALTGEAICYESFQPKKIERPSYNQDNRWSETFWPKDNHHRQLPSKHTQFKDVFQREFGGEVIDITSHNKFQDSLKERILQETLLGNENYTKEEIESLIKENFNDDKDVKWEMDEKLTWHKKTLA